MSLPKKTQSGFSFVELTILLAVVSFFIINLLIIGQTGEELDKERVTVDKLNDIEEALEKHVREYGYYPCPSDITDVISDTDFGKGIGTADGSAAPDRCSAATFENASGTDEIFAGGVPISDLGLTIEQSVDGWGNRIVYAVAWSKTQANTFKEDIGNAFPIITSYSFVTSDPMTEAYSGANATFASGDETIGSAAFVLISYGANQAGAYGYEGGTTRKVSAGGSSALEALNQIPGTWDPLSPFVALEHPVIVEGETSAFDDIVVWGNHTFYTADIADTTSILKAEFLPESIPDLVLWLTPETMPTCSSSPCFGAGGPWWDRSFDTDGESSEPDYTLIMSRMNNNNTGTTADHAGEDTAESEYPDILVDETANAAFNDYPILEFNGANDDSGHVLNIVASSGWVNPGEVTVFVVANQTTTSATSAWQNLIHHADPTQSWRADFGEGGKIGGWGLKMACPDDITGTTTRFGFFIDTIYSTDTDLSCQVASEYTPELTAADVNAHGLYTFGETKIFVGRYDSSTGDINYYNECTLPTDGSKSYTPAGTSIPYAGGVTSLYIGGSRPNDDVDPGPSPTKTSGSFDGHMAEVILYSRSLEDHERELVTRYLGTKYGVDVSGCAPVYPAVAPGATLLGESCSSDSECKSDNCGTGSTCCRPDGALSGTGPGTIYYLEEACTTDEDCCGASSSCNAFGWCWTDPG